MVAPVVPLWTPPLSPQERERLTGADRMIVDAWRFRLNGHPPVAHDFLRLYLLGKRAGK